MVAEWDYIMANSKTQLLTSPPLQPLVGFILKLSDVKIYQFFVEQVSAWNQIKVWKLSGGDVEVMLKFVYSLTLVFAVIQIPLSYFVEETRTLQTSLLAYKRASPLQRSILGWVENFTVWNREALILPAVNHWNCYLTQGAPPSRAARRGNTLLVLYV